MKNIEMLNRHQIMEIEKREKAELNAAKRNALTAYADIIRNTLGNNKAFLRGFVNHGFQLQEAVLRLDRVTVSDDSLVYIEMVDINTGETYVFNDFMHLIENFEVVENGLIGKEVRVLGSFTTGVVASVDDEFVYVDVEGVGRRRVLKDEIIELA